MKKSGFLKIFVSLFFIALLYFTFRHEMPAMIQVLRDTRPLYFAISIFLQILAVFLASFRLKLIFKAQGLLFSFLEVVELSFLGIFFNNFLPTSVGGDLPKAYYAYRKSRKKLASVGCVLGDRFVGLFTLIFTAIFGVFVLWKELSIRIKSSIGVLFAVSVLSLLFLFSDRIAKGLRFIFFPFRKCGWEHRIEEVYRFLKGLNQNRKTLYKALGISLIVHVTAVSSVFILIQSLSASESFVKLLVVFPLIIAVSMLPSLNGLGIREGAFVYFLGGSIGKSSALALSVLWLAILAIQSLVGGVYYLFHGWRQLPIRELKEAKPLEP